MGIIGTDVSKKQERFNHSNNGTTSAPIAAKYGFKKVSELPIYVWRSK